MEAGREADAWVAEHIMGWHYVKECALTDDCPGVWSGHIDPSPCLPYFNTDITAAMLVLEKLKQDTEFLVISIINYHGYGSKNEPYMCDITSGKFANGEIKEVFAETMPLAICRAARAWWEARKEG